MGNQRVATLATRGSLWAILDRMKRSYFSGCDLMRVALIRGVVGSAWFPYLFQALFLVAFLGLAVIGWGEHAPEGVESKVYAKANLVNLLVWGLWWPAMVWVAVWLGRVWCLVCPMELASNLGERVGRALKLPQARLTGWVAAGGLIVLLPLPTLIAVVAWIATFFASRYVSLASIVAALALPAAAWLLGAPTAFAVLASVLGVFVILRHRSNIVRLLNGTENKFAKKPSGG